MKPVIISPSEEVWDQLPGLTPAECRRGFECRRLLEGTWNFQVARMRARGLVHRGALRDRVVLLLGSLLPPVFELPPLWVHPQWFYRAEWRQLPLPGSAFYDDPTFRSVAQMLLREMLDESDSCKQRA